MIKSKIISILEEKLKSNQLRLTSCGAGQHGDHFKCQINQQQTYFIKTFTQNDYFNAELNGLRALEKLISTPAILLARDSLIVMEYIHPGQHPPDWKEAAKQLIKAHQSTNDKFGLGNDNFIGKTPQYNNRLRDWPTFFIEQRLRPQLEFANAESKLSEPFNQNMKRLFEILPHWNWPNDLKPSLCHGDLWSGNIIFNEFGNPYYIDPAIYYGDPVSDLAMAKLFGGFPDIFFKTYHQEMPKTKLFEKQIALYQLYHLINHVNLFGSSYMNQCNSRLEFLL